MVIIGNKDLVIEYESLSEDEKENLLLYFQKHNHEGVVALGNDQYCTYEQMKNGQEPCNIRVAYSPEMFREGLNYVLKYGYAVAVDPYGQVVCTLKNELSGYIHSYKYSGSLDLWLLERYDCIFLYGCNEYSVELCKVVLEHWRGKRLVLVGEEWGGLIPMLPDLPHLECFWEETLTEERTIELICGMTPLYLVKGVPHGSDMTQIDQGIMLYDELMSFTFMFSDYRELGDKNPEKKYFVVDVMNGNMGLFAFLNQAEIHARYVKSQGYIPVVCITRSKNSFYQEESEEDLWVKFFQQPEGSSLEEAMNSQNVYFSPAFHCAGTHVNLMLRRMGDAKLTWPQGLFNDKVQEYIRDRERRFLPNPDKTLGILARGTDYVNTHLRHHAIHATIEQMCDKIDEVRDAWGNFEYIYIATEDADYCEYIKSRYGDQVCCTDQERFSTKPGELISKMHQNREADKRDGFMLGAEYILSVYLLAQCRSMIASGRCGGLGAALKLNDGRYEHIHVFDLGENP